jgi:hypothetical protein
MLWRLRRGNLSNVSIGDVRAGGRDGRFPMERSGQPPFMANGVYQHTLFLIGKPSTEEDIVSLQRSCDVMKANR